MLCGSTPNDSVFLTVHHLCLFFFLWVLIFLLCYPLSSFTLWYYFSCRKLFKIFCLWGCNETALHHFEVTNTYRSRLDTLCPLIGRQIKALVWFFCLFVCSGKCSLQGVVKMCVAWDHVGTMIWPHRLLNPPCFSQHPEFSRNIKPSWSGRFRV